VEQLDIKLLRRKLLGKMGTSAQGIISLRAGDKHILPKMTERDGLSLHKPTQAKTVKGRLKLPIRNLTKSLRVSLFSHLFISPFSGFSSFGTICL
jgi:hypothetical protein